MRYHGQAQEALGVLDGLSGAVEQTAEYLYQRSATDRRAGRQFVGSRGTAGTGRRGR